MHQHKIFQAKDIFIVLHFNFQKFITNCNKSLTKYEAIKVGYIWLKRLEVHNPIENP